MRTQSNKTLSAFFLANLFFLIQVWGQPFITQWKTDNFGISNSTSIKIPTFPGETYNYDVDWNNDGVFDEFGLTGDVTHNFGVAGTYTIQIQGVFPRIYFNFNGDRRKILTIEQWGNIAWSNMDKAFQGAYNLIINAADTPDLSNVTSMVDMFSYATLFNGDLSNWDVSNVTDMRYVFFNCHSFTSDLSNWDVSNVTNMFGMFGGASSFTSDLSSWNVSNVTSMRWMFLNATLFTSDLSNWDVSNVTDMNYMFRDASSFTSNLGNWNVSNSTNMIDMFYNSNLSIEHYDNTLIGWVNQGITNKDLGSASELKYCQGKDARTTLINSGWTINSDTYECPISAEQIDACYSIPSIDISTVNGNNNQDLLIYDNNGHFVCTINANGNDLGLTSIELYVSSTDRSAGSPYMRRDITISPATQPSSNVTVKIYYTATEFAALQAADPTILSDSDLVFTKTDSDCTGAFEGDGILLPAIGSGAFGPSGNIYVQADFSSFSTIHAHGASGALPVELVYFEATLNMEDKVELHWQTASEENNKGFLIERSTNTGDWQALDYITGKGTTEIIQNYTYTDQRPVPGDNYYRLKQIDFDGQYAYSEARTVKVDGSEHKLLEIYPNPSFQDFTVQIENPEKEKINIVLTDYLGKIIWTSSVIENQPYWTQELHVEKNGLYFMSVQVGAKTITEKILILNEG